MPAARRCTVILLRLLGSVCAGPHAGLQSRLCGGNGGGGGLLSDLCRWILRWEENPQPSYLQIITHAADALAAICDGPHHANVVAVCGSAVPGCAARLLATRHEPTLYPADAIRRHRASLASLLLAALGSDAGGSEASTRVARQLAQRGGPLDAATIRALLVNAHAAWCASDETSTTSSTSLDEFSPSMMRWYQPGSRRIALRPLPRGVPSMHSYNGSASCFRVYAKRSFPRLSAVPPPPQGAARTLIPASPPLSPSLKSGSAALPSRTPCQRRWRTSNSHRPFWNPRGSRAPSSPLTRACISRRSVQHDLHTTIDRTPLTG